jgi:glutamyl-tRNA reductase
MGKPTLFILGLNHRTAPVAVRERLAYAEAEIPQALAEIKQRVASVSEVAILSTCNRVEMVGVAADPLAASEELAAFIAENRRVGLPVFGDALYRMEGREAARHLFRVGASLDSMMVGEPQILGQLKLAYTEAARAGTVGLVLHRAFHKAFSTAKRIRKGTLIGHGAVSVSSAAVALARQIFDRLSDKTVMLMGAGKMAELTARQLQTIGIESLLITSRTFDNAVTLARELGGTAVPFDNYRPYLKIADVVIGSISVAKPIIGPEEFDAVIKERRYRPMFLIDLGVPRNFDERLNSIENVYLYDIDDLGKVADKSRAEREKEADKGEEIVEQELKAFERWMAGLDLVPTIKDIRYSIERLRDVELGRNQSWIAALGPSERERVELLTRSLTNKLIHRILLGLRQGGNSAADNSYAAEVARRLLCGEFDLEDPEFDAIEDDDEP